MALTDFDTGPRPVESARQLGLDGGLRPRADRLIRRVLGTHGPLTRVELTGHLATLDIPQDRQVPFHLIQHAALNGTGARRKESTCV